MFTKLSVMFLFLVLGALNAASTRSIPPTLKFFASTLSETGDLFTISTGTWTPSRSSHQTVFIEKSDTGGELHWRQQVEASEFLEVKDFAFDNQSEIVLVGTFQGTLWINDTLRNAIGESDLFVAAFGAQGELRYVNTLGDRSAQTSAVSLARDTKHSLCLQGMVSAQLHQTKGHIWEIHPFLVRLNEDGTFTEFSWLHANHRLMAQYNGHFEQSGNPQHSSVSQLWGFETESHAPLFSLEETTSSNPNPSDLLFVVESSDPIEPIDGATLSPSNFGEAPTSESHTEDLLFVVESSDPIEPIDGANFAPSNFGEAPASEPLTEGLLFVVESSDPVEPIDGLTTALPDTSTKPAHTAKPMKSAKITLATQALNS